MTPATTPANRIREGSEQQEAFWRELLSGSSHVMLEARAGTGKSSSCREGMHRLIETDGRVRSSYVAFNSSIAREFGEGLPKGVTATTMHSAGYAALRDAIPGIGKPCESKLFDIVDTLIPRKTGRTRRAKSALVKLATACKSVLLGHRNREFVRGIDPLKLEWLAASRGINLGPDKARIFEFVPKVLREAVNRCEVIDFSDMIWLPVILELDFPEVDFLFVDEAQDLDPCQHALVRIMVGDAGRMIVVGDSYQAIYAFRGADSRSMSTLSRSLEGDGGLARLPLTMTRRCPASHVGLASRVVPDFESFPGSPEGEWSENADESAVLRPGTLGICRNNAPLIASAFRLVGNGVPVAIQGRDMGETLATFVEGFNAPDVPSLVSMVEEYRVAETERLAALENSEGLIEAVNDRCSCVVAVSELRGQSFGIDPWDVAQKIRSLFLDATPKTAKECVLLSSVHRAKGREAERVAILSPDLLPSPKARTSEQIQQEMNLLYVGITRSKSRMDFVGPLPSPLMDDEAATAGDRPTFLERFV